MEQSSQATSKSHYSFGDSRLAALRLEYLAAAFAPSSRRFLQGTKPGRVELALDLGSAIGATTALVRDVTHAPRVVGYERSGNFLAIARRQYPDLTFRDIDVLSPTYPDREADLIYCRFLLTHIHRPVDVLTTSVQHLRSGGRLLLEETAAWFSPVPAVSRYYDLVEQLHAHHGQETLIGKRLGALAAGVAGARATSLLQRDSHGRSGHGAAARDESSNMEGRSFHAGNPWPARSRRSRRRVEGDRRKVRLSWRAMRNGSGVYRANMRPS